MLINSDIWFWKFQSLISNHKSIAKNLPASRIHSHRTLRSQIRARVFDRRAPFHLDLALRDWSYILRIHSSLFLVIWYWSTSQFYNIVNVNYIYSKLLNLYLISNERGNLIYLKLYRHWGIHSHHDTGASLSIFCIHFCKFLINYIFKMIYFLSNISIQKNNRRLYSSKRFCISTLIS